MADTARLEDLRRRVQRDPASLVFAQLAEEHRRAGEHQEAARICRAGLRHHPEYHSARVTLGRSLHALGQLTEAEQELLIVLGAAPENLLARRELAEIYLHGERLPEALEQFRNALVLAPQDVDLAATVADLERRVPAAPMPPASATFEQPERATHEQPAAGASHQSAPAATAPPATEEPAARVAVVDAAPVEVMSASAYVELASKVEAGPALPPEAELPAAAEPPPAAAAEPAPAAAAEPAPAAVAEPEPAAAAEPAPAAVAEPEPAADLEQPTLFESAPLIVMEQAVEQPPASGSAWLLLRLERWLAAIERDRQRRQSSSL